MIDSREDAARYLFRFCEGNIHSLHSKQYTKLYRIRSAIARELGQPYKKTCGAPTRKVYNNSGDRVPCSRSVSIDSLHCHHHEGATTHPPRSWELTDE